MLAATVVHSSGGTPALITDSAIWGGLGLVRETDDAPENVATPYRLLVGQSATGFLSGGSDEDWFAIDLVAGQSYDFRLLGAGTNSLSNPLLRLMNADGVEIASNDDGFTSFSNTHERDAALTFTASYTGTHYLQADAYYRVFDFWTWQASGRYLLSATLDVGGDATFTVDEIAWQLTNNGRAYFGDRESARLIVGTDKSIRVDLSGLTDDGQRLANAALDVWAAYMDIDFERVLNGGEIIFDDSQTGAFAETFSPSWSPNAISHATINIGTDWLEAFGTTLNSYSFETYLHEIGHALGLAHGGNYNGTAFYGWDNYYQNDSVAWSIMSYMQAYNDEFDFGLVGDVNTYMDASFRFMYSPMIADLIAVQNLYGTAVSAFSGDTTYGFNANTGVEALDSAAAAGGLMAMTVFDTDGIDTLDFSQTSAHQVISLAGESLSSVLGGRHNLGIARGTMVENAISGGGDDVLIGNSAHNALMGGAGNDTLDGGAGNDTLDGGEGGNTLSGGAGDDLYILGSGTNVIIDTQGNNTIAAFNSVNMATFMDVQVQTVLLLGDAAATLTGDSQANHLRGNDADNLITAGAGNDTLDGGAGNDTLDGGEGDDIIRSQSAGDVIAGGAGHDTVQSSISLDLGSENISGVEVAQLLGSGNFNLTGNANADHLIGNSGANILTGGLGSDTLEGGAGHDLYIIDSRADLIIDTRGNDTLQGFVGINLSADNISGVENITALGAQNIALIGTAQNNRLLGNDGNNIIRAGAGEDTLIGGRGADQLFGGAGRDVFQFNTLQDVTNSANATDVIYDFQRGLDRIDLSGIDASALLLGNNAFHFDGAGSHGGWWAGSITYEIFNNAGSSNDYTLIYLDNDADHTSEGVIKVIGLHHFTSVDFIL